LIEVKNISKIYRVKKSEVAALRDVSYSIRKGSFVGITGGSGNGKTTFINIVGGLLRPSCGKVIIGGTDVYKMSDKQISQFRNKACGFVFQNYSLIPGVTAYENVMLPLVFSKMKKSIRKQMAEKALITVGLEDRMNHKTEELSGGQKQRVAIARAIVNSPEIIIADEPTGNLDSKNAKYIMQLLSEINSQGVTILMVTHNSVLKSYFTDNIVIENGCLKM